MQKKLSTSVQLALVFLLFGTLWIILSDALALNFSGNNLSRVMWFQSVKGELFVLLSALLIYLVSSRLMARVNKANHEEEEALRRYNVLEMATNDGVWDLDMRKGSCFTNRTLQQLFSYAEDGLSYTHRWWSENLHPEDKHRAMETAAKRLKGDDIVWQDEYRLRNKKGDFKCILERGFIMRDKSGVPYRLIGALQDVTEQRSLQQELSEQKIRYKNELAKQVIHAQEAERKKLGEELHDNINQLLGVVKLYIEYAQVHPEAKDDMLKRSSKYLMQVISEIRNLSKSLISPTLTELGLMESIHELIERILQTKQISIELLADEFSESILSDIKKLMIYRIIQEQLNNVIKHSQASHVIIEMKHAGSRVVLSISDNGIGFDMRKIKPGTGLNNIRSRLEVFNGSMDIQAEPKKGFRLEAMFEV